MSKMKLLTRLRRAFKVLLGRPLRKPKLVPTNKVEGA
jgi:hypothetical protein